MRVMHLIGALGCGGAEQILRTLVGSEARDIEHHIVSLRPASGALQQAFAAANLHAASFCGPLSLPGAARRLHALVDAVAPDVLHGWMYHGAALATLLAPRARRPVVWGLHHSSPVAEGMRPGTRWLARALARLSPLATTTYVSHACREAHVHHGYSRRRSLVVAGATRYVAPSPSQRRQARADLRRRLRLSSGKKLVAMLARLDASKDFATLLAAMRDLRDTDVLLCGQGLARLPQGLQQHVDAPLRPRLHTLPPMTDVAPILWGVDALVHSSHHEAFGMSTLEAMATGTPCVASRTAASREVMGPEAYLFDPGDSAGLRDQLLKTFTDRDARRRVAAMQARATTLFGASRLCDAYAGAYARAIKAVATQTIVEKAGPPGTSVRASSP